MIPVVLSPDEFLRAASVGVARSVQDITEGRRRRYGARAKDGWRMSVEGACAEAAVAKWLGLTWDGALGDFQAGDVGPYQVRATAHATGCLILHPGDRDLRPYILATGTAPRFVLRGWLWGGEGKNRAYWCDPTGKGRPAFFIPQGALRSMAALPRDLDWLAA